MTCAAGFQFATNNIGEGVAAARLAAESGASWVDLNCGCPIHGASFSVACMHACMFACCTTALALRRRVQHAPR